MNQDRPSEGSWVRKGYEYVAGFKPNDPAEQSG
jgi:hypothetical protein